METCTKRISMYLTNNFLTCFLLLFYLPFISSVLCFFCSLHSPQSPDVREVLVELGGIAVGWAFIKKTLSLLPTIVVISCSACLIPHCVKQTLYKIILLYNSTIQMYNYRL